MVFKVYMVLYRLVFLRLHTLNY